MTACEIRKLDRKQVREFESTDDSMFNSKYPPTRMEATVRVSLHDFSSMNVNKSNKTFIDTSKRQIKRDALSSVNIYIPGPVLNG